MNLQLNHIQHYPIGENGLRLLQDRSHWAVPEKERIVSLSGITTVPDIYEKYGVFNIFYIVDKFTSGSDNSDTFKLCLHPLADYKDVNSKAMNELNCDVMDMIRISELANKQIGLSSVQYGVIKIMCDNHIDFNRLIEAGLAIDINTL